MAEAQVLTAIPAFNAQATLSELLTETRKLTSEILVVDDGSFDETESICAREGVLTIRHAHNSGLSVSMKTIFEYARAEKFSHVLCLDSDLQHPPSLIPQFLAKAKEYDLVLGNRFSDRVGIPSSKIASNLFASCLIEQTLGVFIPDVSCGYRLYRLGEFSQELGGEGFESVYRTLLKAMQLQKRIGICQVPAIYFPQQLLCTRSVELEGLLRSVLEIKPSETIKEIQARIAVQAPFQCTLVGQTFLWFPYSSRRLLASMRPTVR